ncbi:MAG: helicase-associated domain-containing protein [Planctomycetes bacterium]|nr:helicase-associated domain-containing protein [Planctomycetota bacterium]
MDEFLNLLRVSELQEMWEFWCNHGSRAPAKKLELVDGLRSAIHDEPTVRSRIKVLSDRPREVLVRLVRCDAYRGALPDLLAVNAGPQIEAYEVEAAARALARRGFLQVAFDASRGNRETYVIPRDLGETVAGVFLEERRGPRDVFTLEGHLSSVAPTVRADLLFAVGAETAADAAVHDVASAVRAALGPSPLANLEDEALHSALHRAAVEYGGILPRAVFDAMLPEGSTLRVGKSLRSRLESLALGTVTSLALADYGIDLGGETVVLFRFVTEQILRSVVVGAAATGRDPPPAHLAHDRVDSARVDLLTDLQQLLDIVAESPLRVTQGRSIYRAAQHRVLEAFVFHEDELADRERIFNLVYGLAYGLELLAVDDESRLRLTKRGEHWHESDLTDQVRAAYGSFLEERLLDGRDFHVRRLRRTVAAALSDAAAGQWLPLDHVPFLVRNDYFGALDEQGVREQYKNRFQYVFTPPRQTPAEVADGLRDWILQRLYPLGVVEVALRGGVPVAVRATDLGRRLVRGEPVSVPDAAPAERERGAHPEKPLVVNPDFEVILFPDGDVNEVAHRLDRFATRTKSEEVQHYRIARDVVERAVVKGMPAEEILEFLELYSRVGVPQNVAYSIKEWATRVTFVRQREFVLLTALTPGAMDAVLAVDGVQRLLVERLSPTAVAIRQRITDWKTLESLRALGVYFRE